MLRGNMIPCQSREAVVTVQSYHNGVMDGYLQHPRLGKRESICSLAQLILLLKSLQDENLEVVFHSGIELIQLLDEILAE